MPMTVDERSRLCREAIAALEAGGPAAASVNDAVERLLADDPGASATADHAGDLATALRLIPLGHWWHISHLGFSYTPTTPDPRIPVSNAVDHMPDGRPVSYEAMGFDSAAMREALPRLACLAVLRAWRAAALRAMAVRDGRIHLVQTGHGPLAAMPDGRLAEIPFDTRLTADGRLVSYVEAEHGVHGRIEDPDA